jgi:hypothetical protein
MPECRVQVYVVYSSFCATLGKVVVLVPGPSLECYLATLNTALFTEECVTCTGCDARVLIEKEPASFLASSDDSIHGMAQKYQVLQERLVGVDVCELLHEQPCLVCMDIVRGIDQLFQLWDVDTRWVVLRNSYPDELALALRALSEEA